MNRLLRLRPFNVLTINLKTLIQNLKKTFQLSVDLSRIPHANQGTNSSRGSGEQVIRMQLSTRASTSFRFVCSLKQNAGKGILR